MIEAFAIYLALVAAPPCSEMIDLFGPHSLVADVRRHLSIGSRACRELRVEISEVEGGIHVSMEIGGMLVKRFASTPEIAAVLVESWAAEDGPRRVVKPEELYDPRASSPLEVQAEVEAPKLVRIATAGEMSVASDGTLWYGPGANVCNIIGWFCVGGSIRYAQSGSAEGMEVLGRHLEMMGRIEGTIPVSLISLEPSLGLGVAHTNRLRHRGYLGPCERFACFGPPDLKSSRTGISLSTGLGATYRATPWLGVGLSVAISSGPLTRDQGGDVGMWFFRMALGLKIEV